MPVYVVTCTTRETTRIEADSAEEAEEAACDTNAAFLNWEITDIEYAVNESEEV